MSAAQNAKAKALELDRMIEKLLGQKKKELDTAKAQDEQSRVEKKTMDDISPKFQKLTTLHEDLTASEAVAENFMDLPSKKSWDEVQAAVGITCKEDVEAIDTVRLGRKIIYGLFTRGLEVCRGHPKGLKLERNWAKYEGVEAYRTAIARHLKIDMAADTQKRKALDLVKDEPAAKRVRMGEDDATAN